MCIGYPAEVVDVIGSTVVIRGNAGPRRLPTLDLPDVRPGDWVLVAAGSAVRRLSREDAEELERILSAPGRTTSGRTG